MVGCTLEYEGKNIIIIRNGKPRVGLNLFALVYFVYVQQPGDHKGDKIHQVASKLFHVKRPVNYEGHIRRKQNPSAHKLVIWYLTPGQPGSYQDKIKFIESQVSYLTFTPPPPPRSTKRVISGQNKTHRLTSSQARYVTFNIRSTRKNPIRTKSN